LPDIAPGPHCTDPRPCPFFFRCNRVPADDDVRNLYQIRASRLEDLAARGIDSILALPDEEPLTAVQRRQRSALQAGGLLVGDGLGERLDQIGGAVAFLDFETVATSVPRFQGTRPWGNVPAQFSMHRQGPDGVLAHTAWMAEGPEDPRPGLAAALVEASAGADQIVVYSAGFEATCLKHLAEAVPERRTELDAIRSRLVDLLPLVRDHLYSPAFRGSFSLKHVLPALIPELDHTTLGVRSGDDASALLGWLTLYPERFSRMERLRRRRQLLDYCALDTLALVRLLGRLRDLSLLPGRTA